MKNRWKIISVITVLILCLASYLGYDLYKHHSSMHFAELWPEQVTQKQLIAMSPAKAYTVRLQRAVPLSVIKPLSSEEEAQFWKILEEGSYHFKESTQAYHGDYCQMEVKALSQKTHQSIDLELRLDSNGLVMLTAHGGSSHAATLDQVSRKKLWALLETHWAQP